MKIALIGFGNVGQGLEEIIYKKRDDFLKTYGQKISIKKVLIKNPKKERKTFDKNIIFTTNIEDLVNDDEISLIAELSSSVDDIFEYINLAMDKGKNIVTANKALVSKYFEKLVKKANDKGLGFLYEAAVGAGIHIIKPILEDRLINDIYSLDGILNGSCNYILSSMEDENLSYEKSLENAKKLGFVEADPSNDVKAYDSLRKLRILSSLIFEKKVSEKDIFRKGISSISKKDIEIFKQKNKKVKLIASASKEGDKYFALVMPCLLDKDSVFSRVDKSYNILSYKSNYLGESIFYGLGAGGYATANGVLRDIIDIFKESYKKTVLLDKKAVLSNDEKEFVFYLRFNKNFESKFSSYIEKKYDLEEEIAIETKKISIKKLSNLLEDIDEDQYFLAKIL